MAKPRVENDSGESDKENAVRIFDFAVRTLYNQPDFVNVESILGERSPDPALTQVSFNRVVHGSHF